MNVDQVYALLRDGGPDPREPLQWALDHWDEASDRLLSKLRALAAKLPADYRADAYDEGDATALFALVLLFAEKRDTRAFKPLCDRVLADIDISAWLGSDAAGVMAGVFISLCDGDLELLGTVAMRAEGDQYVRASALEAYAYLTRIAQSASDDEARAFLTRFLAEAKPRGNDYIWIDWALAVARLGFDDFNPEVARLFSRSWIDEEEMTLQEYYGLLAAARADPAAAFAEAEIGPIESVIAMLDQDEEGDGDEALEGPHVNPMRDVGRNDPCPCGSGKKYKKCCLVA